MPKQDYLPAPQADFLAWHNRFTAKLNELNVTYGISDDQLAALAAEKVALDTKFAAANRLKAEAKAATLAFTDTLGSSKRGLRRLARQLKAHAAYTEADGVALGIIGPDDDSDDATAKPVLGVRELSEGRIELGFASLGYTGLRIYSRREGESALTFLAVDTDPPYVDTRPLALAGKPEVREYQARYLDGDDEVGLPSDIVKAVARA
jgi:hypothetical protein